MWRRRRRRSAEETTCRLEKLLIRGALNAPPSDFERSSSEVTKKQADNVSLFIAEACEKDAQRIQVEKNACEAELAKAMPFVEQASEAIAARQSSLRILTR